MLKFLDSESVWKTRSWDPGVTGFFSILCLINFPWLFVLPQCNASPPPTCTCTCVHVSSQLPKLWMTLEIRGCCSLLKDEDTKVYCGIVSKVTQPGVALLGIKFRFSGPSYRAHLRYYRLILRLTTSSLYHSSSPSSVAWFHSLSYQYKDFHSNKFPGFPS